ncbi:hypothetical protein [Methanocella sp. MCL-LM]|uniref:hypothetical protein n=1 Tax=Methanocella sp. MCL-LM TaxID=3412035 RepID=UPI003C78245C
MGSWYRLRVPHNTLLVILCLLLIALSVLTSGCGEPSRPPFSLYQIGVTGLDGFRGEGFTEIFVPIPVMEGQPLFADDNSFTLSGNWSLRTVDTDRGKMYALQTNDIDLTNIDMHLSRELPERPHDEDVRVITDAKEFPLYPVSSEASLFNKLPDSNTESKSYTSYVYIGKDVKPKGDNGTIIFDLVLDVTGKSSAGQYSASYHAYIGESIPANVTGWIPVTVKVK